MSESDALPVTPEEALPDTVDVFRFMTQDFTDSVIRRALEHRSELTHDSGAELDFILNNQVTIPQFPRYPAKAPLPFLRQAILRHVHHSDLLAAAVLKAWFASQLELRDIVVEQLHKLDETVAFPDFQAFHSNGYMPSGDWTSLCDGILDSKCSLDRDEVALMLCCVTGRLPKSIARMTEDEEEASMNPNLLQHTLAYLNELPADAAQWESEIPTFLSAIAKLSEEKATERAKAELSLELAKVLNDFREQHAQLLEYFEFDVANLTEPAHSNESVLVSIKELLGTLSSLFEEHGSVPQQGSSLTETRQLNRKREEIEERIIRLDSVLRQATEVDCSSDESFHDPDPEELVAPQVIESESPSASVDAGLSDLHVSEESFVFDSTTVNQAVNLPNSVDYLIIEPVPNNQTVTIQVSVQAQEHNDVDCVEIELGKHRVENIGVGQTTVLVTVTAEDRVTVQTYMLSVERLPSTDATLRSLEATAGELEFDPTLQEYSIEVGNESNDLSVAFETTHAAAEVVAKLQYPDGTFVDLTTSDRGICEVACLVAGKSTLSLSVAAEDTVTTRTYSLTLNCGLRPTLDTAVLMWSLVADDDLAGAYWIAKSLALEEQVPTHLPALLSATQAARWLSPESRHFVEGLSETVLQTDISVNDDACNLLAIAASIEPCIIAPESNLLAWLDAPMGIPSVGMLVSSVKNFASRGYAIGPEHIRGDEWNRRIQHLISEANSDAKTWLSDSTKRYHNLVRANNVWRHLCTDGGMLENLLIAVAEDHRSEVESVKSDVEALRQEAYRIELINDIDRSVHSRIKNDITGAARDWLHRGIVHATELAKRWCDSVERANESSTHLQNKWLSDHVANLRTDIAATSPDVLHDLFEVASDSSQSAKAASALSLARSIVRLLEYLSIEHNAEHLLTMPPVVDDLQSIVKNSNFSGHDSFAVSQIEAALSRRLLWIRAVELLDDGLPVNANNPIDPHSLGTDWFSLDIPLRQVLRSRIDNGDFRFLDLLPLVSASGQTPESELLYSNDLSVAKETLEAHLSSAQEAVDRAVSDGVIEYEGVRWSQSTNSIEDIREELADDKIRNLKKAHDILEEIEVSIREDQSMRRDELASDWKAIITAVQEESGVTPQLFQDLSISFDLASRDESPDIRVMEDCVSRLRDFQYGDSQELGTTSISHASRTLEDFLHWSREIREP